MKNIYALALVVMAITGLKAQETFPVNGIFDKRDEVFAITNATLYIDYKTKIDSATLVVRKGKVEAAGKGIAIPKEAVVVDVKGYNVYPSFIDLYTEYGIAPVNAQPETGRPQIESTRQGAYNWNEAIKPEVDGQLLFKTNATTAEAYRNIGFGTVLTHQNDGIARGSAALVALGDKKENDEVLKGEAAAVLSFHKGVSHQDYPSSLMGTIALLRQTYYDAQWYKNGGYKREYNISLDAWNRQQYLPQLFDAGGDVFNILRADKIAKEFGVQYIIKADGDEFKRLDEIKATRATLVVPINFPKPYDVEDPFDAENVSLAEMKAWELAPADLALLDSTGINFCITVAGLTSKPDFLTNLRKAVLYGLPKEDALKALTYNPAMALKVYDQVGSLEKGKVASFIVVNGDLFDKNSRIIQNWVKGERFDIGDKDVSDLRGKYKITVGDRQYNLEVDGKPSAPEVKLKKDDKDTVGIKVTLVRRDDLVTLTYSQLRDSIHKDSTRNIVRLTGLIEGQGWKGSGELPNGSKIFWNASYAGPLAPKKEDKTDSVLAEKPGRKDVIYPFVAYGYSQAPKARTVLIKNATVWTNTDKGVLKNTDVLIRDGKIASVGNNLSAQGADTTIDGTGKHLTNGIVDEHSHLAIAFGVNEGGQTSSAEVRIGDVINPEDIDIYRQLAGGVTTAQLLHGSANPIGGQSGIVKFRWGYAPEKMKFENAPGFIKFALGENVKQSNWGDFQVVRYPQTRMGVEQVYVDYFTRAREYDNAWKKFNGGETTGKKGKHKNETLELALRRDLELDALAEILNKKRFITCHSYVQSEINMLMKVADRFGFTLNTFTHVLEGYKVADKLKAHGANGSTFSDWWDYKYEVIEAIPYNAAIMTDVGVNTCINSDDAEMGRRLNQEAAKTVKYGGMTEEQAWKMVTLNPAKALHLDKWIGTIETGKDADLVLWSDNPLSIYAHPIQTYVDGICFFDERNDEQMRKDIEKERARLIQKMLAAKAGGAEVQKPVKKVQKIYHCDDMEDYR